MIVSDIKIGILVRIYNQEHIWHNEIGIIRGVGLIFSRVELLGKLTWVPNHWLVEVDEGQLNAKGI
jgi:hypothetical protein